MVSKKELQNQINQIKEFIRENPITDGNAYQSNAELEAILALNYDGVEQKNPFIPYGLWFEILQIANYFGGLVNIKTENEALLKMWDKIHQLAFIFGLVGVEVVGEKLRVWGITKYKINDFGEYYDLEGLPWNIYLTMVGNQNTSEGDFTKASKRITGEVYILSNNQQNMNVWLTWVPFLKARKNLLERLDDVVLSNMKNYVISGTAENPAEIQKMIKALRSPKTAIFNFAFKDNNGRLSVNKLNVDTLDTKLADLSEFLALIDWYNNYWYQILGKRTNNAFKRERNVEAEVDASNANFDVLEAYIFNQSLGLLKWLKTKGSFEAEITNYAFQDKANDDDNDKSLNGDKSMKKGQF